MWGEASAVTRAPNNRSVKTGRLLGVLDCTVCQAKETMTQGRWAAPPHGSQAPALAESLQCFLQARGTALAGQPSSWVETASYSSFLTVSQVKSGSSRPKWP